MRNIGIDGILGAFCSYEPMGGAGGVSSIIPDPNCGGRGELNVLAADIWPQAGVCCCPCCPGMATGVETCSPFLSCSPSLSPSSSLGRSREYAAPDLLPAAANLLALGCMPGMAVFIFILFFVQLLGTPFWFFCSNNNNT